MTAVLELQERLDFGAVGPLKSAIEAEIGNDLELDASGVKHLGTLCLQVLIAASHDWAKAGHKFHLTTPSDTCATQLALHGFSSDTLTGASSS